MATVAEPTRKPGRPKDPDLESRRKAEILDAAAAVFAKDGFADTDVQVIADRVGVSKGTVYRYFETKDALFLAAVDRGLSELSASCDTALLDDTCQPLKRVERAVVAYLSFFHRRPEMAELFIQERAAFRDRRKPLYFDTHGDCADRDLEFVRHLMVGGVFRETDAKQLMDVFGDLLFGTILSNHLAGRRVRPEAQAHAILDVMFHGMLSDAERKRRTSKGTRSPVKPHVAVFLATTLALAGCAPAESTTKAPAELPPVPVAVTPVTLRTVPRTIAAVGTLNGWEEVMIAPKGEGRVVAIRADVGDRVLPGSILLELDPTDARLAVSEMKRALEAELARLGLKEIPTDTFDVEAVPGIRTATVAVLDATRRLRQKESLKGAGSPDEIEIAQTDLKLAEARKAQALTEAEAALAAAKMRRAQLDTAEQRLRDCVVEAPVPDGFYPWAGAVGPAFVPVRYAVAQRLTAEGEMIRSMPVTNTFKLVLDFTLKLKVQVPEQAAAGVRVGQAVELRVDAFPDRTFPGRVGRVNPTVDPLNRTFSVEIEVPNASGTLKAGGFAKATLLSRTDANVVTVPPEAVVAFAGITKVFVLDGDRAKAIEIKPGTRDKGRVELIGPVPPDARVIVSGLTQVVDGSAVRIRE